jgi:hypothetical protein
VDGKPITGHMALITRSRTARDESSPTRWTSPLASARRLPSSS